MPVIVKVPYTTSVDSDVTYSVGPYIGVFFRPSDDPTASPLKKGFVNLFF